MWITWKRLEIILIINTPLQIPRVHTATKFSAVRLLYMTKLKVKER